MTLGHGKGSVHEEKSLFSPNIKSDRTCDDIKISNELFCACSSGGS